MDVYNLQVRVLDNSLLLSYNFTSQQMASYCFTASGATTSRSTDNPNPLKENVAHRMYTYLKQPPSQVPSASASNITNTSMAVSAASSATRDISLPAKLVNSLHTLVGLLERHDARLLSLDKQYGSMKKEVEDKLERIEDLAQKMDNTLNTFGKPE